jgi:hypothetical protein
MTALDIEGEGDCGWQTLRRRAVPAEDMMQAFIYRHLVAAQKLLMQVTDPEPITVSLNLPKDRAVKARPGSEIKLNASVKWHDSSKKGIKLQLSDPPEWLTLKTGNLGGQGGQIILNVSPNAEPGSTATVLLNGILRTKIPVDDPNYNPVVKFKNFKVVNFAIDAVSIEITN